MSDSTSTIYLIAGATRGIGLGLVDVIASKDQNAIIYAGGRNPSGAPGLLVVAVKYPGRIELVKYVAGDKEGNEALAKGIEAKHGRVDTVIANAGINDFLAKVHETPVEAYENHFHVNTLGPIVLFQAVRDLLKASTNPKFIPISSLAGSIDLLSKIGTLDSAAYSMSKTALNWVTRKIHYENEWLVAFPMCPGTVYTDMAKHVLSFSNSEVIGDYFDTSGFRSPDVAAEMLYAIIAASTRAQDGGEFHSVEGLDVRHPW